MIGKDMIDFLKESHRDLNKKEVKNTDSENITGAF